MQVRGLETDLFGWFERPAAIVALTARMLLAAGLFMALFLKLYMFLLTDLRCDPELASIGNAIRCSSAAEMISGTLILAAGLGIAAALFSRNGLDLAETVLMVLCAVAISFLSDVRFDTATWQTAAVILTLTSSVAGLTALARLVRARPANSRSTAAEPVDTVSG